jgi:aconitate hydratase
VFANACGPCIGMWNRKDVKHGVKNSIVTTFNRNFAKRADGNPETYAFVAGAETAIALAAAGRITFDPSREVILNDKGEQIRPVPPSAHENPSNIAPAVIGIAELAKDPVTRRSSSIPRATVCSYSRLSRRGTGRISRTARLIKVKGKCTTDHISPAGPWLK